MVRMCAVELKVARSGRKCGCGWSGLILGLIASLVQV